MIFDKSYQEQFSFIERSKISQRILLQKPGVVPIIIERAASEKVLPKISNRKYLVPQEMTVGALLFIIMSKLGKSSSKSIWLYAGKHSISGRSLPISNVYNSYRDPDGFLYLQYKEEDTFG